MRYSAYKRLGRCLAAAIVSVILMTGCSAGCCENAVIGSVPENPFMQKTDKTGYSPETCKEQRVLCVDDEKGPAREYKKIQKAVDRARPGDTVLVFDGTYRGFRVARSGEKENRITIRAAGSNVILNDREPGGSGEIIYIENSSFITIDGFRIDARNSFGYGIGAHDARFYRPMLGLVISNNEVFGAPSTNIYLSQVADSLIEGNTTYDSQDSHGIYLANAGSKNTTIRGNNTFHNARNGIHFNGDASVGGDGIHTDLVITNNVIHDNKANGLDMDGVLHSEISNNLIYNNGRHAIRAFRIDAAQGPSALKIINNTCVVPAGYGWGIKLTDDLGGHSIFNNILAISSGGQGSIFAENKTLFSDANIVDGRFSRGGTVVGLDAWHKLGRGLRSSVASADEIFSSPGTGHYSPRPYSVAVDTGIDTLGTGKAPSHDILFTPRPQGKGVDIGAIEYLVPPVQ